MKKSEIPEFLHPYTVSDKRQFMVQHPAFTMTKVDEIELSAPVRALLEEAHVDPSEIIEGIREMLQIAGGVLNLAYETRTSPGKGFAAGMLIAANKSITFDVLGPWMLIGYLLSLTPSQVAEVFMRNKEDLTYSQLVGFSITHPLVMKAIDNDEELFNAFGYISGGDYVWSNLITKERAARIPRTESNSQVLAWCVMHDLITDLSGFPKTAIQALLCEGDRFVSMMSSDQIKMCADMHLVVDSSATGFIKAVESESLTDEEIAKLTAPELGYIFMNNKLRLMRKLTAKQKSELLSFLTTADTTDKNSFLGEQLIPALAKYPADMFCDVPIASWFCRKAILQRLHTRDMVLMFLKANQEYFIMEGGVDAQLTDEVSDDIAVIKALAEIIRLSDNHLNGRGVNTVKDTWGKRLLAVC